MPTVAELKAQAKAKAATKAEPVELIEVDQEPIDETQTLELIAQIDKLPVLYSVNDNTITEARNKLALLKADSKEGYKLVLSGLSTTRKLRTSVEKQRKDMKRPALDYGKRVDAEAERLRKELEAIEVPLTAEREKWEAEQARIKREAEEAEAARIEAERQEQLRIERERIKAEQAAEAARLKAEHDARMAELEAQRIENERIAAEQKAERDRLAKIEAEQAERDRIAKAEREAAQRVLDEQREALEAAKREMEAERQRIAQAESDRLAKIEADRIAAERAEREAKEAAERAEAERIEAERMEAERIERERVAAELAEAMKPDIEKINALAGKLQAFKLPEVVTPECKQFLQRLQMNLNGMADSCSSFPDDIPF